jgi:type II secretory pathway pseudopilin PulG
MTKPIPNRRNREPSEEGYILLAVIFLLAIFTIALAVAAPRVAREIQRDREIETMHRGKQYARAVRLYYKKFGAYPPNVDALVMTNQVRFLRKKYIDPTTGKEDWKPVYMGQAKAPTAMGFFGQALAGLSTAPSGMGSPLPGAGGSLQSGGGSSFGQGGSTTTQTNLDLGDPATQTPAATGASGSSPGSSGNGTSTADANSANSGSPSGLSGQTFGGRIMGFSPNSPKQSILIYKKKNHYNEWEFVYDPIADATISVAGAAGANGQPSVGSNTGILGQQPTSPGIPSGGSTPVPAPIPPAPPQ